MDDDERRTNERTTNDDNEDEDEDEGHQACHARVAPSTTKEVATWNSVVSAPTATPALESLFVSVSVSARGCGCCCALFRAWTS